MGKKLIIKGADFFVNFMNSIDNVSTYFVILNTSDSTLGTVSGSGKYEFNSVITISATPILGASFIRWSDGDTNPVRQITVTKNINLTAHFSAVLQKYGVVTFNGTEDWKFNASPEPNKYGFYNCYLMNPDINNAKVDGRGEGGSFYEATCSIPSLNRLIPGDETRLSTTQPGFGYYM